MRFAFLAALAAGAALAQVETELERIARVATAVVDGDEAESIMTPRALEKMFREDPRDRFSGSDNFDVNDKPFIAVKKLLRRVATLAPFLADCNLWMGFRQHPELIQMLVRQVNEISAFWRFGEMHRPMPPEMKEVFTTGKPKTVRRGGVVSVLTPVYNSLGDVVGLVEVAASAGAQAPAQ